MKICQQVRRGCDASFTCDPTAAGVPPRGSKRTPGWGARSSTPETASGVACFKLTPMRLATVTLLSRKHNARGVSPVTHQTPDRSADTPGSPRNLPPPACNRGFPMCKRAAHARFCFPRRRLKSSPGRLKSVQTPMPCADARRRGIGPTAAIRRARSVREPTRRDSMRQRSCFVPAKRPTPRPLTCLHDRAPPNIQGRGCDV